jgi:hypothetical protein
MLARLIFVSLALIYVAQCSWITKYLELPRVRPAVAQVGNKLYIAGGQIADGIETTLIEVLNLDTFDFEDLDLNLPSPRQQCSAVPIGSKIYFSGGLETQSNLVIFNETSAVFSLLEKAPLVRNIQHIQFLNSSALCVFGDRSLDIYNAVTKTWTTVEEYRALVDQIFQFGFGVVNNVAYIVGGIFPSNGTLSTNVWTFDLLSHKLTCHNNTILPQYFPRGLKLSASATAVIMNGGCNGSDFNQIVNILNLDLSKWFSTTCDDLSPALNAISLGAVTDTHAYIAIDAKNTGLNAKIKLVNLANFQVSLSTLPLLTGTWKSLVAAGDKIFACGQGAILPTYYILDGASINLGLTLTGALPELSFEVNGKFMLLSSLGDIYKFDPLAIVLSLIGLQTPSEAIISAKVVGQKLVVAYASGEVSSITASGVVNTQNLDEEILGIFGDNIVTTANTYLASTLASVKAVTGDVIPTSADIIGLLDTLPGTCTVMNILTDVVSQVSQTIDVYDTVANVWSSIDIPTLTDKTLAFAGTLDDCLIFTASNIAYIVNTTTATVKTQLTLDDVDNVVDTVRAFVQAPQLNSSVYVGIGGNIAEVTLTSSDLTVRADADLVINHMVLLDDVLYVADVESTEMYFYDLVDNVWNTVDLGGKLVNYAIAAVNDTILVVGGNDGTTAALGGVSVDVDTMLLFHPLNGTLTALNADINARSEITPFTTLDVAIFIGGQNSYGQHQSTVNIFSARVRHPRPSPALAPILAPARTPILIIRKLAPLVPPTPRNSLADLLCFWLT